MADKKGAEYNECTIFHNARLALPVALEVCSKCMWVLPRLPPIFLASCLSTFPLQIQQPILMQGTVNGKDDVGKVCSSTPRPFPFAR